MLALACKFTVEWAWSTFNRRIVLALHSRLLSCVVGFVCLCVSFRPPEGRKAVVGRMASSDSEKLNGDAFQVKGREARKYAREDFDFEKILGEGSYSTVSCWRQWQCVTCTRITTHAQ